MGWALRLKWNRIAKIAILVCMIVSVIFAGFTVYGANVGDFVISIEETNGTLAATISEEPFSDDADLTTRLNVPALSYQRDATLSDVPSGISQGLGSKNDDTTNRYLAYSFYLVNVGETAADYVASVDIVECNNNTDDIVRFMILLGDESPENGDIYAKTETSEQNLEYVQTNAGYEQIDFVDDFTISSTENQLAPTSYVKYTIVMWLEGWDADCTDDKIGGSIRLEMTFEQIFD